MNEAETRAELIDPALKQAGWGVVDNSRILRERNCVISEGRILGQGKRAQPEIADYILEYNNIKLAVIEAKKVSLDYTEGVAQAKAYAKKLHVRYTYSTNGKKIYNIDMLTGEEKDVLTYPSPQQLWAMTFEDDNKWRDKFAAIPFESKSGTFIPRYYQEIAVNKTLEAIANNEQRILLTLATGTGKTVIAFQIAWKLFKARWNLNKDGQRQPRILILADRNILADQAFNSFSAFSEDALVRIAPDEIRKKGKVPTNGSLFFTIFQTFMSGPNDTPYFGEYPKDFFDFIVIDECHRGGANDESTWRDILNYFSPAVQLGLTATPKRDKNVDTYEYFGEPVYIYSLKEGINDGFLTPFRVKQIQTTLDEYVYTSDDEIVEGEVDEGKLYIEEDFNKIIEIEAREKKRVEIFMNEINQDEKAIVFCSTQIHALAVRNLVNQMKKSTNTDYCVRVTANDGLKGEKFLRDFQDNENTIPTILTTSVKLSTGVDARNIRNIILMRPVNSMIEFKQIIGRGTRLFEGKDYFTIYDFVKAYKHFNDPEWDGEPIEPTPPGPEKPKKPKTKKPEPPDPKTKIVIKLADGKVRAIQHMTHTSFWSIEGKPISAQDFLNNLYGCLPSFFKSEEELRNIWKSPDTRKQFLNKIEELGYGINQLEELKKLIKAEDSDIFDVLCYVGYATEPITRKDRVESSKKIIYMNFELKQQVFIDFVLAQYIKEGVDQLDSDRLPNLIELKYHSMTDGIKQLGNVTEIRNMFIDFQKYLYDSSIKAKTI